MKKYINKVIFILSVLACIIIGVNINAQPGKICPGGGHKPDDNILVGKVTFTMGSDTVNATHGIVKIFRVNMSNLEVIAVDSSQINPFGYYGIFGFPSGDYYIVAYPNDKDEDYMLSFYPSGPLWTNAQRVSISKGQVRTCNIRSTQMFQTLGATPVTGETADSINHNYKLRNSIIIARSGNQYRGFAMTNNQGKYVVSSIPQGNYNLTATRIGYRNQTQNVNITSTPAVVNFYMARDTNYTISVSGNETVVKDFKLYQNYPNPFNPSTEIAFSLDRGMDVKLAVYSIDGKIIKELVNDYRSAGEYKIKFSGDNLASGIYNYVLETGNGARESKLMVYAK